ncbi:SMI1/KNR4 family protein [Mucilaginibacter sp. UR6-1]|uniref:SMI1/KNR4 family protein n=1 Tax=Mucilaginibacter sp. UR6-1 TaxID=1435643 RepID=UPI001E3008BA|nr:SMI1/KNR4 family protein [Mucilaginibacter sp. UR6-1]MCC8409008.1 SMI1/KNR4 family protein [Mucilaginibacter sp. UR6-1]
MKDLLKEISKLAIQSQAFGLTNEHKQSGWLGNSPATMEGILKAERRLGVELPNDYKEFLLLTNGFFTPCDSTEPIFEAINNIDHLKNIDAYLLEIWNEGVLIDVGKQLNRAIVVAGMEDEQYFLLIPPDYSVNKWQYWKFANWIPGEERYESLKKYFTSVLNFMKDHSEKS